MLITSMNTPQVMQNRLLHTENDRDGVNLDFTKIPDGMLVDTLGEYFYDHISANKYTPQTRTKIKNALQEKDIELVKHYLTDIGNRWTNFGNQIAQKFNNHRISLLFEELKQNTAE